MVVRHKCLCPDLIKMIRCYMKYVASCSCGKDSLAMILALIEKAWPLDYVVFFDAGKEFKSIYRNWEKLKKILDSHACSRHRVLITTLRSMRSKPATESQKPVIPGAAAGAGG